MPPISTMPLHNVVYRVGWWGLLSVPVILASNSTNSSFAFNGTKFSLALNSTNSSLALTVNNTNSSVALNSTTFALEPNITNSSLALNSTETPSLAPIIVPPNTTEVPSLAPILPASSSADAPTVKPLPIVSNATDSQSPIIAPNSTESLPATDSFNTSDAPSFSPISLDVNATSVNCTTEMNGNVSVVQCTNATDTIPKNTTSLAAATTTVCESMILDYIDPRYYYVCSDFCGPGSSFGYVYQEVGGFQRDGTISYLVPYAVPSFIATLSCDASSPDLDISDVFLVTSNFAELCFLVCGVNKALYTRNEEPTDIATYTVNFPSPLPYRLADGRTIYLGVESILSLACIGETVSASNCECSVLVRPSVNGDAEFCDSCTLAMLSETTLTYGFDCSNIFPYDVCAVVTTDGRCNNKALGLQCAGTFNFDINEYIYTCENYCGPASTLYFTFDEVAGSPESDSLYIYDPAFLKSQCQLNCKGEVERSVDCAPFFASGDIGYRDICSSECQINLSPYLELTRTTDTVLYLLNSLSPLQKPLHDGTVLFVGDDSYFYMECLIGEPISVYSCVCGIAISFDALSYGDSTLCNSCEIGYFDDEGRPVYGFDCTNEAGGTCAIVTPEGKCTNIPTGKGKGKGKGGYGKGYGGDGKGKGYGKGYNGDGKGGKGKGEYGKGYSGDGKGGKGDYGKGKGEDGKGKGESGKGKGEGGKGKGGKKPPREPMSTKAMMASDKGTKKYLYYADATATLLQKKESDPPKGPIFSKQDVS